MGKQAIAIGIALFLSGCGQKPYQTVFSHPVKEWDARAEKLSDADLKDAYEYGITKVKPPVIIAEPVVQRGKPFVNSLIDDLSLRNDDYISSSFYQIASLMEQRHAGSACEDKAMLSKLREACSHIRSELLRSSFATKLHNLCNTSAHQ